MYGFDLSLAASLRIYSGISLTPEDVSIVSVFVLSNSLQQPEKTRSLQATNNTLPERKGESVLTNVVLGSLGSSSCCFCSLLMQAGVLSLQGLICRKWNGLEKVGVWALMVGASYSWVFFLTQMFLCFISHIILNNNVYYYCVMCVGPAVPRWSPRGSILFGIGKKLKAKYSEGSLFGYGGRAIEITFWKYSSEVYRLPTSCKSTELTRFSLSKTGRFSPMQLDYFIYIHMQKEFFLFSFFYIFKAFQIFPQWSQWPDSYETFTSLGLHQEMNVTEIRKSVSFC